MGAWKCVAQSHEEMMQRVQVLPQLWRCRPTPLYRRLPLCTLPPEDETHPEAELQNLVVTASGPDGPGIVARLSKRVLDCGGNVQVSRMSRLAGEFSILMLVSFDVTTARKAEQLRNSLLEIEGLQVNTRWTSDELLKHSRPLNKFRKILLRGVDNPEMKVSEYQAGSHVIGLVYNLTEYLSSRGINIESLETYTQEAPSGSEKLFMMEGVIAMPVGLSTATFIHNIDTLQASLGAEISISDLPNPAHKFAPSTFQGYN